MSKNCSFKSKEFHTENESESMAINQCTLYFLTHTHTQNKETKRPVLSRCVLWQEYTNQKYWLLSQTECRMVIDQSPCWRGSQRTLDHHYTNSTDQTLLLLMMNFQHEIKKTVIYLSIYLSIYGYIYIYIYIHASQNQSNDSQAQIKSGSGLKLVSIERIEDIELHLKPCAENRCKVFIIFYRCHLTLRNCSPSSISHL